MSNYHYVIFINTKSFSFYDLCKDKYLNYISRVSNFDLCTNSNEKMTFFYTWVLKQFHVKFRLFHFISNLYYRSCLHITNVIIVSDNTGLVPCFIALPEH